MSWDVIQFWGPSDIEGYITNVSNGFTTLAADIKAAGSSYPTTKQNAFNVAHASFKSWRDGVTWISRLSLSPLRIAEQYAEQLKFWRTDFTNTTAQQPTGAIVPVPSDESPFTGTVSVLGQGTKLVGLGIAGYLAYALINGKRIKL